MKDQEGGVGQEVEKLTPRVATGLAKKVVEHALNPNELWDMVRKMAKEGPVEFVRKRFVQPLQAADRMDRGEDLGLIPGEFGIDLGEGREVLCAASRILWAACVGGGSRGWRV